MRRPVEAIVVALIALPAGLVAWRGCGEGGGKSTPLGPDSPEAQALSQWGRSLRAAQGQTRAAFLAGSFWDQALDDVRQTTIDRIALVADHLTAEYRIKSTAQGRTVDEWKLRANHPDNHWLDCLVGCAVAASIQGAVLPGTDHKTGPARKRIKLSEIQRSIR